MDGSIVELNRIWRKYGGGEIYWTLLMKSYPGSLTKKHDVRLVVNAIAMSPNSNRIGRRQMRDASIEETSCSFNFLFIVSLLLCDALLILKNVLGSMVRMKKDSISCNLSLRGQPKVKVRKMPLSLEMTFL